ncbi:MAG: DUF3592 domain-containing protein [Anaerolineae bacterium]|nr:DUF3592 domain-containing protein [Anaerolineae bacterium]
MPDFSSFFGDLKNSTLVTFALASIPFLLIMLFLFWRAMRGRGRASQARNWPFVTGAVVDARVEARRSSNSRGGYSTSYYPVVNYEYEVQGHRYRSNQLYLGDSIGYGSSAIAENKVAPYLSGNRVTVYYDPQNPGVAVLERASPSSNILLFVVVLILAILLCTAVIMLAAFGMFGSVFSDMMNTIQTSVPG